MLPAGGHGGQADPTAPRFLCVGHQIWVEGEEENDSVPSFMKIRFFFLSRVTKVALAGSQAELFPKKKKKRKMV